MQYGVMGCVRALPVEFPLEKAENSGNMVHGDAPFKILPGAVSSADQATYRSQGYSTFVEYVNEGCSHLILTLANTLRLDRASLPNLERMTTFVDKVDKPIVVFGLGAQSMSIDVDSQAVPPEAIKLLRKISEKTTLLGVRGEFTAEILKKKVGVDNAYVTGCPSIFSRPDGIRALRSGISTAYGRLAFNGTKFHQEPERRLIQNAIERGYFIVEPVNKFNHRYFEAVSAGHLDAEPPYFLKGTRPELSTSEQRAFLSSQFRQNYRLFRNLDDWFAFNRAQVSATFGSRFHVNMASLLSGTPALWLRHDARTHELIDYLSLPYRDLSTFAIDDINEVDWQAEYAKFLTSFEEKRQRFEVYLDRNGLPVDSVSRDRYEVDESDATTTSV